LAPKIDGLGLPAEAATRAGEGGKPDEMSGIGWPKFDKLCYLPRRPIAV
jgi:hypothetical protein